ncbi:potassium channel subfamily K member 17 isoform X2 [Thunnus maccoyii]|uniref:potassium channel subfamily K member 17 isoform X2 n=1 Tax=Thunnus maccoyii TaxID=8240 RepID=UPI001C4D43F5|nr:potassium channel subfamily K member 17 isoform X2 [Thunnus maccoyii]
MMMVMTNLISRKSPYRNSLSLKLTLNTRSLSFLAQFVILIGFSGCSRCFKGGPEFERQQHNGRLLEIHQLSCVCCHCGHNYSFAGYGNMSPSSTAGQIFCVFFALFGIPLNMVVLNRVGKYMLAIERNISDFLHGKTGRRRCTRFFVHLVSYLTGVVLFFIAPMIVFQMHEGWTYSQTIYYCFITLSTIGFGDFVADSNPDRVYPEWYSVLMASWIFFGLAWLALIINHSIDILERLNTHFKLRWSRQKEEEKPGSAESDNPETQVEEDEIKKPPITQ